MPKPPNKIPTIHLNVGIRADLKEMLDQELWDVERGRVPHGAYKDFFEAFLENYFKGIGV